MIGSQTAAATLIALRACPGTVNQKTGQLAQVVGHWPDRAYPLARFPRVPTEPAMKTGADAAQDDVDALDLSLLMRAAAAQLRAIIRHGRTDQKDFGGDRSAAVFYVCCGLHRAGVPELDIVRLLNDRSLRISDHIYDKGGRDPRKFALRQVQRAREKSAKRRKSRPERCYEERDGGIYLTNSSGGSVPLSNFTGRIVEDIKLDDGSGLIERRFIIEGSLGRADVPASQFEGMSWVTREWGALAIITPGNLIKPHLAAAMKTLSGGHVQRTVYAHLGWRKIGERLVYLHADGAIDANGRFEGVEVQPGAALSEFRLPIPRDILRAVRASLKILNLGPARDHLSPSRRDLLCASCRVRSGDVSLFLTGASGTFKTAIAMLAQAHWGATHTRPPANWASTPNSLERIAFQAKDALLLIDDFAPRGSIYDIQKLHAAAERLLRAQANRSGRHRMNADGSLRAEMYPRGLIVATGEDVPSGHSLRARLLVVEISPGDIDRASLTEAQDGR